MLGLGLAAQTASTIFLSTPAFLIPFFHLEQGLPLTTSGLLASAPTLGMVLTLVLWGALADRYGERLIIAIGLLLIALASLLAVSNLDYLWLTICFILGGAAAASPNAASGRVVVGWFPRRQRGLAMGIRQMSQPLGVALAALIVPPLAQNYGTAGPLLLLIITNGILAVLCAFGIQNPPRPTPKKVTDTQALQTGQLTRLSQTGSIYVQPINPYRSDGFLWRVHAVSALLVIPQYTLAVFGLIWMVAELDLDETTAGLIIAAAQFIGALGRVVIGKISDHVTSRVGLIRQVALSCIATMVLLALLNQFDLRVLCIIVFIIASTISVADNGIAFTSVAEAAGHQWAGKALGMQNTGQYIAASMVGPGVAALIGILGYPLTFGLVALAPLASVPLLPRRDIERS